MIKSPPKAHRMAIGGILLAKYPIMDGRKTIGYALLEGEGRVWKITCKMTSACSEQCCIYCVWLEGRLLIGRFDDKTLNATFVKRVSKNKMAYDDVSFFACLDNAKEYVLTERTEIEDISSLRFARIKQTEDSIVLIVDQSNSRPTGQWSEPIISE